MATIYPAALSHFAVFCPALGPDEENTHEQLLFYAAAALPAFYPYSANDYFARNMHLRRRSSGGTSEAAQTGHTPKARAGRSPSAHHTGATGAAQGATHKSGVKTADDVVAQERVVSLDTKLREIGLGAALISFAGSFGSKGEERRFHTVHSEKRRTLIYEPERGVLVQLSVVLPRRVRPFGKERDAYSIEFLDAELSDQALRAWLQNEYNAFYVLFGPVGRVLSTDSCVGERLAVKRQLEAFFGRTMWQWDQRWDPKQGGELDLLFALQPMPLLPVGPISLGGFDEFWRDLGSLRIGGDGSGEQPLVHSAVVLWRGKEVVWSSWGDASSNDHDGSDDDDGMGQTQLLRALVTWSRAVFAPAFDVLSSEGDPSVEHKSKPKARHPSRPPSSLSAAPTSPPATTNAEGGWSLPGSNWLWNWRSTEPTTAPVAAAPEEDYVSESDNNDDERSSGHSSAAEPTDIVRGGISQALSRAVNALVEPRAPTPPEVDPVFMTDEYALSPADIAGATTSMTGAMLARDADAESVTSLASLASVQTTRTAAAASAVLTRHTPRGRTSIASTAPRNRSNTMQHANAVLGALTSVPGWQQSSYMRRSHAPRAPSVATNASAATAESTQLRADTRVSARGWWPSSWTWGSSKHSDTAGSDTESVAATESIFGFGEGAPMASGVDAASTFLFTGAAPFPGLVLGDTAAKPVPDSRPAADPVNSENNNSDGGNEADDAQRGETVGQLGLAMEDAMPAAYEHGVGVDCSRGVVLAPRAIPGMLYDTRLVRLLYHSPINAHGAVEQPLFVCCRDSSPDGHAGSRTLAYKFGDLLFLAFGAQEAASDPKVTEQPNAAGEAGSTVQENTRRRRRGRRANRLPREAERQPDARPFTSNDALAIEASVLRYAESLHAATQRDARDVSATRAHEMQLARQRRLPPYVFQTRRGVHRATHTSWQHPHAEHIPSNRSYAGFAEEYHAPGRRQSRSKSDNAGESLPASVRHALDVVNVETQHGGDIAVCVRMQDKGWVAGSLESECRCFCVVDQPKATLADAQSFLTRISLRAASFQNLSLSS